jgi:hypothetical protein
VTTSAPNAAPEKGPQPMANTLPVSRAIRIYSATTVSRCSSAVTLSHPTVYSGLRESHVLKEHLHLN